MLDNETKRRIDSARDILVGKVPDPKSQVEQITIALVYKFMDDMDKESVEMGGKPSFFTGDYQKYGWSKIFSPQHSGYEMLGLYADAITRMSQNPNIPQLFRDIFKNAYLPYHDPETLKLFLKTINEFIYDHSERLGDAFEYLLSVLGSQGDAGQFRTPRHIIDFMVQVVNPQKNETVLDPACGTAGFLISAYKHIIRENTSSTLRSENGNNRGDLLSTEERKNLLSNFKGFDISPDMVRLSLVNLYLHGFVQPQIYEYDTLGSEDRWNEYADVILANPPFMSPKGGIRPHKRFSVQSNRSEVLFVDYIAEHLTPSGRAAVIVPEGIIFQSAGAYKQLRKMLVENHLYAVVSLPAGVFNPYSGVKTSILFLDRSIAKKAYNILFLKIENDGFGLGAQRREQTGSDLPDAINVISDFVIAIRSGNEDSFKPEGKPCSALLVSKEKLAENGEYNLTGDRYKMIVGKRNQKWPMVELWEYTEIKKGSPITKDDTKVGEIPVIAGGQSAAYYHNEANRFVKTITVSSSGAYAGFLNYFKQPIFASDCTTITSTDEDKLDTDFLFPLLKSRQEDFYRIQQGMGQPHVYAKDFQYLKIPLPPIEVQREIVAEIEGYQKIIDGARQVVENYNPHIEINPEWEIVELGKLCNLSTGGTPKSTSKEYYEGGQIKWLVSGDIHKEEIFDCEGRITQAGMESSNAKLLPINSVLIALNGQGKTRGTVAILRTEATCNQSLVSIDPIDKKILLSEFLYIILKSKYQEIRNITGDNQRSGLNMPIIRGIKIPLPDLPTQQNIVARIEREQVLVRGNNELIEVFETKIKNVTDKVWEE